MVHMCKLWGTSKSCLEVSKAYHWYLTVALKEKKGVCGWGEGNEINFIYYLIKENIFSLLCFLFLAQRESTWQKLQAPAQSLACSGHPINMGEWMNKKLPLSVWQRSL